MPSIALVFRYIDEVFKKIVIMYFVLWLLLIVTLVYLACFSGLLQVGGGFHIFYLKNVTFFGIDGA